MITLLYDLRFALRQLRRSPGFTCTAVLTLALGIAANVVVLGVLDTMILQPLNLPHADHLWTLGSSNLAFPVFSFPEIRDLRDSNTVFSAVGAFNVDNFGLESGGNTRAVWGYEVSGQYFDVVSIKPFLGRLLGRSDDDHPGASDAAVLSWGAWNGQFGADPAIIGKHIHIDKHPYTIVGVTPRGFFGTEKFIRPDIFVPMANQQSLDGVSWLEQRHDRNLFAVARAKDGLSQQKIQAELNLLAARIERQNPKEEEGLHLKLSRPGLMGDYLGGPARAFLAGVMVLAGIVLLAACANLGSLFAARTADRARELSIRLAIGSSRWRVVRQVLVEAFLVSILGGICACGLAWLALTGLSSWHPPSDYPIQFSVSPQPSLLLASFLISLFAGVVCGVMPLRQIFKTDPNDAIKSGGSQASGRRWALRDFLLAAQIALCCVTVTAAFVSLRGLTKALTMDLGFNPRNALMYKFDLAEAGYSMADADRVQRAVLDRVAHLPGIQAVAYASTTPLSDTSQSEVFPEQTTEFKPSNKLFDVYPFAVSPEYFATAETPLLAGRSFTSGDTATAPRVAVVNVQFAHHLLHSETTAYNSVLGQSFKINSGQRVTVIGVVPNGKYLALTEDPREALFYPIAQQPNTGTQLIVRAVGGDASAAATTEAVRKVLHDLDPVIPLWYAGTWRNEMALNFFPAEVATATLGLFGAFGLLLSVTGTFGLASYTVSKRLRELSIRVALGARSRQVLAAALGRMLTLLATGSLIGVVLGVATSRLLSAIVYHASAQDPLVLAAVALTMLLTGALSVAGPVRRALHLDPATLLREQ